MAFDDILARDPKSEEEFWTIIEETFVQVEGALTAYPAETREEALAGTLRDGNFKDASISFIRYRGVRDDLDSRDYFLELGRKFLPKVERQIKERKLTANFAKDWGVVMMCHGFISAHILDDSDGLSHNRAGLLSVESEKHRCAEEMGRASNPFRAEAGATWPHTEAGGCVACRRGCSANRQRQIPYWLWEGLVRIHHGQGSASGRLLPKASD